LFVHPRSALDRYNKVILLCLFLFAGFFIRYFCNAKI
jgi:hypothetical protein